MHRRGGLANEYGDPPIQQVMGPTTGISCATPTSGRGSGRKLWAAMAPDGRLAASNSSVPTPGSTQSTVTLQQQLEFMMVQNREQAARQAELIALLVSERQMVATLQNQVQALTVDMMTSRLPAPSGNAPSISTNVLIVLESSQREHAGPATATIDTTPVGGMLLGSSRLDRTRIDPVSPGFRLDDEASTGSAGEIKQNEDDPEQRSQKSSGDEGSSGNESSSRNADRTVQFNDDHEKSRGMAGEFRGDQGCSGVTGISDGGARGRTRCLLGLLC